MKRFEAPFYSQIIKLVIPIVLQSLLSSAVNSVDVVMLVFCIAVSARAEFGRLKPSALFVGNKLLTRPFVLAYAVPLALLSAFVFKLPVLWVYFLFCTDEFTKWPWIIHRCRSGKWVKGITRERLFQEKA